MEGKKSEDQPSPINGSGPDTGCAKAEDGIGSSQEIAELTETIKRVQAEFVNFRERTERDRQRVIEQANRDLLKELIGVIDIFDMALGTITEHTDTTRGFEMVHQQLLDLLRRHGVKPIDQVGVPLDPRLHEVVKTIPGKPARQVATIVKTGYRLHDYVLRPAQVEVYAGEGARIDEDRHHDSPSRNT